jgi:hypothetical protein
MRNPFLNHVNSDALSQKQGFSSAVADYPIISVAQSAENVAVGLQQSLGDDFTRALVILNNHTNSAEQASLILKAFPDALKLEYGLAQLYLAVDTGQVSRLPNEAKLQLNFDHFRTMSEGGNQDLARNTLKKLIIKLIQPNLAIFRKPGHGENLVRLTQNVLVLLKELSSPLDSNGSSFTTCLSADELNSLISLFRQGEENLALGSIRNQIQQFNDLLLEKRNNMLQIQDNPISFRQMNEHARSDYDVVLVAVQRLGWILRFANTLLRNNSEIVLPAVQQSGWALQFASAELQNDRKLVLIAIQQEGRAIQFASPELQADRELVLSAIHQDGAALHLVLPAFRSDREVVLAAVQQNGLALQFASPEFQNDSEVVLAAIQQNIQAFRFSSPELQCNSKLILTAVLMDSRSL